MTSKHTPGPWVAWRAFPEDRDDYDTGVWVGVNDGEGMVSHAVVRYGCSEAAEIGDIDANARLIAAAPDLLAALVSIVERPHEFGDIEDCEMMICRIVTIAQTAIDRATGN